MSFKYDLFEVFSLVKFITIISFNIVAHAVDWVTRNRLRRKFNEKRCNWVAKVGILVKLCQAIKLLINYIFLYERIKAVDYHMTWTKQWNFVRQTSWKGNWKH